MRPLAKTTCGQTLPLKMHFRKSSTLPVAAFTAYTVSSFPFHPLHPTVYRTPCTTNGAEALAPNSALLADCCAMRLPSSQPNDSATRPSRVAPPPMRPVRGSQLSGDHQNKCDMFHRAALILPQTAALATCLQLRNWSGPGWLLARHENPFNKKNLPL